MGIDVFENGNYEITFLYMCVCVSGVILVFSSGDNILHSA